MRHLQIESFQNVQKINLPKKPVNFIKDLIGKSLINRIKHRKVHETILLSVDLMTNLRQFPRQFHIATRNNL